MVTGCSAQSMDAPGCWDDYPKSGGSSACPEGGLFIDHGHKDVDRGVGVLKTHSFRCFQHSRSGALPSGVHR
jgi:hypothetical protein